MVLERHRRESSRRQHRQQRRAPRVMRTKTSTNTDTKKDTKASTKMDMLNRANSDRVPSNRSDVRLMATTGIAKGHGPRRHLSPPRHRLRVIPLEQQVRPEPSPPLPFHSKEPPAAMARNSWSWRLRPSSSSHLPCNLYHKTVQCILKLVITRHHFLLSVLFTVHRESLS